MLSLPLYLHKRLFYPANPSLDYWCVCCNQTGVLTSLNQVEIQMAIPAVTLEYTPGSCRNSKNPMRDPPHQEMRLNSPAWCAEQSLVPNQTRKETRFSWWNNREPQEHCDKMRWTLMSLQECKIFQCTPTRLEMKPISPSCLHSYPMFHIIQYKWIDFL